MDPVQVDLIVGIPNSKEGYTAIAVSNGIFVVTSFDY
jgi:hypothetical protein